MRALGVDLGDRRIGLSLSDPSGTLARPWKTIERRQPDAALVAFFAQLVETLQAEEGSLDVVVVGHPKRLDGTPHEQTARVEAFAAALAPRVQVPVVLQDERLSSHEAEMRLSVEHRDWRERKRLLDAAAAAVILQDYLDRTG